MAKETRKFRREVTPEGTEAIKIDVKKAREEYLRRKHEDGLYSQRKVLAEIIEHLAKSDPSIERIVSRAIEAHRKTQKKHHAELREAIEELKRSPKGGMQKGPSVECYLASTYPKWCWDPETVGPDCYVYNTDTERWEHWCSKDKNTDWIDINLGHGTATAEFYASARGSGVLQDEWITNCAKWAWRFTAGEDEEVEIDVNCFLSGPCVWSEGGDVTLWIRGALRVISFSPDDPDPYLDIEESIRLSFSTISSMADDGPPPQGYFSGDGQSAVTFSPTASNPRIRVRAGRTYVVVAVAILDLMADYDAAIILGEIPGMPCRLKALCRISKDMVGGLVRDKRSGVLIPRVKITFVSEDGSFNEEVTSDNSGHYQISLWIGIRYVVTATHPYYEDYSPGPGFVVVTGGYQIFNIFMEHLEIEGVVAGLVIDERSGVEIPRVKITFVSEDGSVIEEVTTNNFGSYHIFLRIDRYVVTAAHPYYEVYSTAPGFLEVGEGWQRFNINMEHLEREGVVGGLVIDERSREKIPRVKITFVSEDGSFNEEVTSDNSGHYQISLWIGRYRAYATHPDYEVYSTAPGFQVVREGINTFNIYMKRLENRKKLERKFVIAKCAGGLGFFDQECKDKEGNGYPIIDEQERYKDNPTCKVIDMCGIQAHAGRYMIGSGGKEFEFDINKYPSLYLTMKAEKGTDTCLLLMVHDKKPKDYMRRFVAIGKTPGGNCGCPLAKDSFIIKDDNKWHDYTYDLRKLQGDYPDAETVRMVQFYSGKLGNGTQHAFHFSSLVFKK